MSSSEDLIRPDELRRIASEKDMAAAKEAAAKDAKAQEEAKQLYEAFNERQLRPDVKQRVSTAVKRAAERGVNEVLIMEFPSDWCTDRGRAINNAEADWPGTLTGHAKRGFEFFEKELRPLGYRLRAEIISFPGGVPGDVGLYLKW